jgi:t-SNARE complex subunit (syntaxin)
MSGRDREKERLNRYSQERQGLQPEVKAKLEAEQNRKLKNSKRQSQEIRV